MMVDRNLLGSPLAKYIVSDFLYDRMMLVDIVSKLQYFFKLCGQDTEGLI